jgi:hypothetical protein
MDPYMPVAWINEKFIPVVDPEDIKALRNLSPADLEKRFFQNIQNPVAYVQAVQFRMMLLYYAFTDLGLPEFNDGEPSDAIVKAAAKVPVKVTPNLEYKGLPCDLDELLQLIEKEKGSCDPLS